jgi:hypothetical protein
MMYNVTLNVLEKIGIADKSEKMDDPDEGSAE